MEATGLSAGIFSVSARAGAVRERASSRQVIEVFMVGKWNIEMREIANAIPEMRNA